MPNSNGLENALAEKRQAFLDHYRRADFRATLQIRVDIIEAQRLADAGDEGAAIALLAPSVRP